jgi:DNA processing protein
MGQSDAFPSPPHQPLWPPETPAGSAEELLAAEVVLAMTPGLGPRLRAALVERLGSPQAVLAASPSELRAVAGIGPKLCASLLAARQHVRPHELLAQWHSRQMQVLAISHPDYPAALRSIPDPPSLLFVRGTLKPSDGLAIAIVGTRHATPYGIAQAQRLAGGLARAGFTIVSGLARGIDAAAHQGALAAGGRTLAVLGSGVCCIYPPEHTKLAEQVLAQGALVSECPPDTPPVAGVFPARNRIITGLSLGVIIVEAADRSGALISARHAAEQGREVFAVPGRVDSRTSRGCHRLIRDGAKLVETVDDVLQELGPLPLPTPAAAGDGQADDAAARVCVRHPAELQLNEPERKVLAAIGDEPVVVDQVIASCGLEAANVLATLSVLEMRRLVRRVSGNRVMRNY